jgi:hypothetical protein
VQATFGKRLLNIYVTDMAGRRIGIGRSFSRSFAKSFFSLFFYLALVSAVTVASRNEHCTTLQQELSWCGVGHCMAALSSFGESWRRLRFRSYGFW